METVTDNVTKAIIRQLREIEEWFRESPTRDCDVHMRVVRRRRQLEGKEKPLNSKRW